MEKEDDYIAIIDENTYGKICNVLNNLLIDDRMSAIYILKELVDQPMIIPNNKIHNYGRAKR